VYATEVFAQLDVEASNRQTLMSARNEALRAAEQRVLDQVKEKVDEINMRRVAGQRETRVLNEINASKDAITWEARHKVVTGGKWQLFEQRLTGVTTKAFMALTLMDAYLLYYQTKMSRYVTAPYVLEDEQGLFTLEVRESLLSPEYYKTYTSGRAVGQRIELSSEEFHELKKEAEALWGTTDWKGDFVPGLLNRVLPVIEQPSGI
jgi:hypothetical protein